MQKRGQVARYDSPLASLPTEILLSGDGDIALTIHYTDDVAAFAKGGLVDKAEIIKKAGRYGDTEIVHVNKEELAELRELWGEPTINPETGCPEYFLKKAWKGIKKIAKPLAQIAPIAAMFIPGIGPLAAAAIGAGSGLLGGGGLKGALVGGALGGLGASGLAGKAVGSLAPGLSPIASRAASGALMGGLGSAVTGKDVLGGALTGGALGAAIGPGGLINPRAPATVPSAGTAPNVNAPGISGVSDAPFAVNPGEGIVRPTFGVDASAPLSVRPDTSQLAVKTPELRSWANRPFLGISDKIPNKLGVPIAAGLALSAMKPKASSSVQDFRNATNQELVDAKFQPIFKGKDLPAPKGIFANLGVRPRDFGSIEEQYRAGYMPEQPMFQYVPEYAEGGDVDISEFAVRGDGDGREDLIDAKLSDGEYIIDAETVALLGNGSSKAGAKALDNMRVNIRRHKGRSLAKGKFSGDAKAPENYMRVKHGR